jgi:hypothetical protein
MIFRCDCCGVELRIPSVLDLPVQLVEGEQLCQTCQDVVLAEGVPLLAVRPSLVLSLPPVVFDHHAA